MKAIKQFFKLKKHYEKAMKHGHFPVNYYLLYDSKTKLALFEPFAAVDDFCAKIVAKDKFYHTKLKFDYESIDLIKLLVIDYVTLNVEVVNEFVCSMSEVK